MSDRIVETLNYTFKTVKYFVKENGSPSVNVIVKNGQDPKGYRLQ